MSKYIKYPTKKLLKGAIELHESAYQLSGTLVKVDHEELVNLIGNKIIVDRSNSIMTGYFKEKETFKNYYINGYFYLVRALIKPYCDEINVFINDANIKTIDVTGEMLTLRNTLDEYFIEAIYKLVPKAINSGLPIIFCDTLNENNGDIESYYLL